MFVAQLSAAARHTVQRWQHSVRTCHPFISRPRPFRLCNSFRSQGAGGNPQTVIPARRDLFLHRRTVPAIGSVARAYLPYVVLIHRACCGSWHRASLPGVATSILAQCGRFWSRSGNTRASCSAGKCYQVRGAIAAWLYILVSRHRSGASKYVFVSRRPTPPSQARTPSDRCDYLELGSTARVRSGPLVVRRRVLEELRACIHRVSGASLSFLLSASQSSTERKSSPQLFRQLASELSPLAHLSLRPSPSVSSTDSSHARGFPSVSLSVHVLVFGDPRNGPP
ncbi:hypothetical protein BD310DRAFT_701284 [Dichomitus squalens]|uniref:Uncharacterized protein n=1 Tax=Dichomitus squalens TaxID=114155 RepID=A0A4Q9Q718_9APHY|nr:hypothetical protein BD310DRAFT_701284 [Dichomitus squalens]